MATGTVSLGRQCGAFETLAPTTSTGISSALIKPARVSGTSTAADTTTVTLASGSSTVNGYYTGWDIYLYGAAAGSNQKRVITGYVGSTLVATVGKQDDPTNAIPYVLVPPFDGLDAQEVVIVVDGATNQPIRWRCDGVAPTATVGNYLSAGAMLTLTGSVNIKAFRCIDTAAGASSVTINVMF